MRAFSGINARIVRRLRGSLDLRCVGDEILAGAERLPLRTLTRAVGYQQELYVGQRLALALSFHNGRSLATSQEDPCWSGVLGTLDRLRLTEPLSPEWTVRLLAGERLLVLRERD